MIFEGTKNQFFFGLGLTRAGSGQPLAENQEGADLTRDRVYKLADYLR